MNAPSAARCFRSLAIATACLCLTIGVNHPPAFAQGADMDAGGFDDPAGGDPGGEGAMAPAAAAPTANLTTGPTPMAIWQLTQPDWSPLWKELGTALAPSADPAQPPVIGPTLRNEAHVAFRYGNLPLARELLFAYLARGGEEAQADLQNLMFSVYFKRPAWQLRWGVSLGLHGDTGVTDYAPIQSDGTVAGGDPSATMEGDLMENAEPGGPANPRRPARTPDLAEEEMQMSADAGAAPGMGSERDSAGNPITKTPEDSVSEAIMTDPAIEERFEELMGLVASTVAEGMQSRMASGQFGKGFASVDPAATNQGTTVGGEFVSPGEAKMWIPGVIYLGEGSSQEMSKAAAKAGVELLLHFDVAIKEFRGGPPQNSTRVKVIDGRNGKTLLSSGAMDSREVARLLQAKRGTAEGHVAEGLGKFWPVLDSKLSLVPFPKLAPEKARLRVAGLLADTSLSALHKLAEIRYYAANGLLSDEELAQAFEIVIGADGLTILYGPPADAISILRQLARQADAAK